MSEYIETPCQCDGPEQCRHYGGTLTYRLWMLTRLKSPLGLKYRRQLASGEIAIPKERCCR